MKSVNKFLILILSTVFFAGFSTAQTAPAASKIDTAALINDLKTLSADDMEGRGFGQPGGAKALKYVEKRFKESGLTAFGSSYLQPFQEVRPNGTKLEGANVIGYIEGKRNPERYIIVTAHFDHLGIRNGQIFNGADDNASGTSALFAMAAYFKRERPENTIIFAALDGEEGGLRGAKKLVAELPVKKESVLMNVNMDMIARGDKKELYASGTFHYPQLKPLLEALAKSSDAKVKLLLGHDQPNPPQDDWTNQSDHFEFHKAKIPFIYFGVEDHPDYHRATDDFEKVDQTFFINSVETILEAVKIFDAKLKPSR